MTMAAETNRGIPTSLISPKFLHSNSTSHTWPFSAIAELIGLSQSKLQSLQVATKLDDNAYDPDVNAKQFWINKTTFKDQDCLIFMDNGKGMDYDKMHKMLSFGFSEKQTVRGHVPVGLYGNGFKSGSMRLGKDAIVFSKQGATMCVGFLSQTYLKNTGAQNVIVPIAMFSKTRQTVSPAPEHAESLHDILKHSLFQTEEELLSEFNVIEGTCTNASGTRIIIWNLHRTPSGELEFDFIKNPNDIRIPVDVYRNTRETNKRGMTMPESEYSLRAYCSILYLKPRMQIILQGLKVETQFATKMLAKAFTYTYKPAALKKGVKITFGYNTKSREHYGLMMYHKNRLIKAYERVACQRKTNNTGEGVIGVIECNYLTPTHNKQDFEKNDEYRKTMNSVGAKLEEYWREVNYAHKAVFSDPFEDTVNKPDQTWVQCDNCLKWRKLSDGIQPKHLPKKWSCSMNPDPQFRDCTFEEELEDCEDKQHRFLKAYKQQEKIQKLEEIRQQEIMQKSTLALFQMTPTTSDTSFSVTPNRKKKALGLSQENPEQKKARKKSFEKIVSDLLNPVPACVPAICNDACDANKAACKDTETALKHDADHQSNEITELCQQVTEIIRSLQDKLIELKKELKKEGSDIKMDSLEYEQYKLSNCYESLQKYLKKIKTERKNVKVSVEECAAPTTTFSPVKDSQLNICKDETKHISESEGGHRDNDMQSPLRLEEFKERMSSLLVTFVPDLDVESINKLLTQIVDEISPSEAVVLTKGAEFQEEHLSCDFMECEGEDSDSITSHHPHTGQHSVVPDVIIPELVQHYDDTGAYRFLCSHAGQFHCKMTNLGFEMKGKGNVLYTIMSWDKSQLQGIGHFQPAGPLYNIDCSEDSIIYLYLPHCETNTDPNQIELAVAHFSEGNVEIMKPLKITSTHVILDVQCLSLYGLLKKLIFWEKPISAQVLLFYKEIIGKERRRKLHIHLLPGNVPVEEVQKRHQCNAYIQCSSICQLTPGKRYRPLCEPHESQPKIETFGCDYGPNYHPTFEVILNTDVENLKLGLLDENGQQVWEPRQVFLTAESREAVSVEMDKDVEFVDKHRDRLIQRVSSVMEIADTLLTRNIIKEETYNSIKVATTTQDKMRILYTLLDSKGRFVKAEFYKILKEKNCFIVDELESSMSNMT